MQTLSHLDSNLLGIQYFESFNLNQTDTNCTTRLYNFIEIISPNYST